MAIVMSIVRKHYRKVGGKKVIVRKHSRSNKLRKEVRKLKSKHSIKAPIDVKEVKSSKGNSMAHTDTVLDKNSKEALKHTIYIEPDKIKSFGESVEKILQHELGHVLDLSKKGFVKTPKGKEILGAIKNTKAFMKLKSIGNKYSLSDDELFARAYAQHKSGKKDETDLKTGNAWTTKDFKKVKSKMKKHKL